jgi:hypothetical protein
MWQRYSVANILLKESHKISLKKQQQLDGRDNLLFLAIGHFLSPEQVSGVSLQRQWVALPSKIS